MNYIKILLILFLSSIIAQNTVAQSVFKTTLSGSNEVPTVATSANGSVTATLNGNQLIVEGSFEELSSEYLFSHLHAGMAGSTGGVFFTLTATTDADGKGGTYTSVNNTFTLSSGQIDTLMARGIYVNVHSENYGAGELRGQLTPQADAIFRTNLSGSQEVPSISSMASGAVVLEMVGDSLFVSGSFNNLSGGYLFSHLHSGMAGSNGGVAFTLNATVNAENTAATYFASDNRFELTIEQKSTLMNRGFYVNVHSEAFQSGELRGQVTPPVTASFYATLSGSAEVPSINSSAAGAVVIELTPKDSLILTGSFTQLQGDFDASIAGGSHLHAAHAGANGGVDILVNAGVSVDLKSGTYSASDNTFSVDANQIQILLNRGYYLNIHTNEFGAGELRGQVLADASAYFKTNLNGIHQLPKPVETDASGVVNIELTGNRAILVGGFQGLTGDYLFSHLHSGSVLMNGGVELTLDATVSDDTAGVYEPLKNTFTLSETQISALYDQGLYVNVHSQTNQSGELRGQVLFGDNVFPDAAELLIPLDNASVNIVGAATTGFEVTWSAGSDSENDALTYIWQAATDSAFSNIVINANVGADLSFSTTFGTLDTLLSQLNVQAGGNAIIYHRVLTSDGSNVNSSNPRTATLEKGMVTSNEESGIGQPSKFNLDQNYPNPFNPSTQITFSLSESGPTQLTVYNMLGQKVATLVSKRLSAGEHSFNFRADNLASGIYIYRLQSSTNTITKRMTLIK